MVYLILNGHSSSASVRCLCLKDYSHRHTTRSCWIHFSCLLRGTPVPSCVYTQITLLLSWRRRRPHLGCCCDVSRSSRAHPLKQRNCLENPPLDVGAVQLIPSNSTTGASSAAKPRGPKLKFFNLNTFKLHSLGHYADTIRRFGTTDSYSTQIVCPFIALARPIHS
jgi:hypothetical protein